MPALLDTFQSELCGALVGDGRVFVVIAPTEVLVWTFNKHLNDAAPPFGVVVKDAVPEASGPLGFEPEPLNECLRRADALIAWTTALADGAREILAIAADPKNRGVLIVETVPARMRDWQDHVARLARPSAARHYFQVTMQ